MTNVSSSALRVYQKQQRAKKKLSIFTKVIYNM
jgi:hypothetical protein